jgi:hypothetical protein
VRKSLPFSFFFSRASALSHQRPPPPPPPPPPETAPRPSFWWEGGRPLGLGGPPFPGGQAASPARPPASRKANPTQARKHHTTTATKAPNASSKKRGHRLRAKCAVFGACKLPSCYDSTPHAASEQGKAPILLVAAVGAHVPALFAPIKKKKKTPEPPTIQILCYSNHRDLTTISVLFLLSRCSQVERCTHRLLRN